MIPLVERFQKSVFSAADMELQRQLRLQIDSAIASVVTEDGDSWVLTTTFRASAMSPPAPTPGFTAPPSGFTPPPPGFTTPTAGNTAQLVPGTVFDSLVSGFFSDQPSDLRIPRSIRTNNPGALNISEWQKSRKGYAGFTGSDGSSNQNQTTIYRTPEHGIAAWFHLLEVGYKLNARPSFRLGELAQLYAGVASGQPVDDYVRGWTLASNGDLQPTTDIDLRSDAQALVLARAMFAHEIGKPSPVGDDQIAFGITREREGTLPA